MTMLSTATDEKIDTLRTGAETLLDCGELQRFKAGLIRGLWNTIH